MDTKILIFLGIAVGIIILSWFLHRVFRREIEFDKRQDDLNANPRDADSTAVWTGIDKGTH